MGIQAGGQDDVSKTKKTKTNKKRQNHRVNLQYNKKRTLKNDKPQILKPFSGLFISAAFYSC